MLHHAFTTVRRDDTKLGPGLFHLVQVRETHCPRMEGGDLVVVQISGDEGLRGKTARHLTHVGAAQAQFVEALQIGCGIVAHRCHDGCVTTEQHQVVSNIAGTATILATHFRHQESHVQDMDLLRQDVVLEAVGKDHDVVEGQ